MTEYNFQNQLEQRSACNVLGITSVVLMIIILAAVIITVL
jgi:hypothetical protein